MTQEIEPTYEQILQRCEALEEEFPDIVSYSEIGPSGEGRPIPMLTIGDTQRDAPLFMAIGGMHGSEETGRAAAIALAEWFPRDGQQYLDKMSVVVIPCGNPDGTVRNQRGNAQEVDLCRSFHPFTIPEPVESIAIDKVLFDLLPDCCVDLHGLAGGGMGDYEFLYANLPANMSLQAGVLISAEMGAAVTKLGIPIGSPRIWGIYEGEAGTPCQKLGHDTNALVMVVETSERYYPLDESVKSAMARLKVLVDIGTRIHFNQHYPGFPCDCVSGGPICSIHPFGNTYRQRRENRWKLMKGIHEGYVSVGRSSADPDRVATVTLLMDDKVITFPEGVVFQLALDPRATVKTVSYRWPDGETKDLPEGETHGWMIWNQDGIPMVRISVDRVPLTGKNSVIVEYDAPYAPHTLL